MFTGAVGVVKDRFIFLYLKSEIYSDILDLNVDGKCNYCHLISGSAKN